MNKPWDEFAAALEAILPSENHRQNVPSQIANLRPLNSPEQETQETMVHDRTKDDLRAFLESEEDNFHPADVVLGFVPRLAMNYFPGTLVHRQRARAYEHLCGGSSSKCRVDEFAMTDEIFDPVITMEEYADQLIDSVHKQGGRFLRLDPLKPGINIMDRELARIIIVNYIARTDLRRSQILSKRKRWITNKFQKTKASDNLVDEARNCLSKHSSDPKPTAFKAKKSCLTKAVLKSSVQHVHPNSRVSRPPKVKLQVIAAAGAQHVSDMSSHIRITKSASEKALPRTNLKGFHHSSDNFSRFHQVHL